MEIQVKKIIKTATIVHSFATLSGTAINSILGLGFYIILARFLGAQAFGVFSISVVTLTLISDIASLGTDTGIINFVGKYINKDKEKALKFLKLGLKIKLLVGTLVIIVGWIIAPFVATYLLAKPELEFPLRLALLGAFIALLFSFATSSLQAVQKFWIWSAVNISSNLLRLIIILTLFSAGLLSVNLSILTYVTIPLLGFFMSLYFLPPFLKAKNENSVKNEFFHYNKWVAVFILVAAISGRLDTFLVTRILTLKDVGIYSVAVTLSSIVPQIVSAIATVVAPKIAGFDTKEKVILYLKKLQIFVTSLSILGILSGILVGYIFITRFYGKNYLDSFVPFVILLIAQALFLISIPAHTAVFYYFSYPKLFVLVSLVNLSIIGIGGWFLTSNFGFIGTAMAVLIGNISNFVISAIWVISRFRKQ
ncbi:MAG: oligosaccharide flippase family protein [Candidatus Woesebacteria bacterium]|nr:MAG: oligosaccharide flippase family protein [Candidatus Woesebacteria bacterium]